MHNVIKFVIFTSWQRWNIAFKCYWAFDKGMLFKIYFPFHNDFDECTLNIKPNIIIFTCPFYFEGLIRSVKYLCSYWNNLFWPNYLTNIHFQVASFENIFSLSFSVNDFDECTLNIKPNIIIFTCPFYFEGLIRSVKYLCSYWNNLFWPNYLTNIHFQVASFENIFSLSFSVNDFDECTLNIKPNIIIFTCPFYFEGLIRSVKYLCSYWNNLFWPNYLTNIHFQVASFENIFSLSFFVNFLYIISYTWGLKYMIVSISSFLEIQFNFGRSFLEKKKVPST